jgi:alpha-L-fucosidase
MWGPRSDGTITEDDQRVLRSMGKWLKTNGESIYDTTFWYVFGEGPTKVPEGSFTDVNRSAFTSEDIRFTYKAPCVYANILSWPESGEITIKSMGVPSSQKGEVTGSQFSGHIEKIEILGFDNSLTFTRDTTGLHIKVRREYYRPIIPFVLK